jgi:glucosylceramidase
MHPSRRTFLKLSSAATASAALAHPLRAFADTAKPIRAWRTSPTQEFAPIPAPSWQSGGPVSALSIRLDPSTRAQKLLGFGAAMTDASCYLLSQLDTTARRALLDDAFGPHGLRLSVARTTIGASDYSLNAYTYDDTPEPDPALTHFSLDHDRKYILPVLRDARAANPGLFLFSSPWTPPAWMKDNKSLLGGTMRNKYFPAYAQYFRRFLEGYSQAGVPIQAVTVQNEVDTNQDGRMPQCQWGQEYEMEFAGKHLGPALAEAHSDTKIWIIDHNYNLWGRAVDELSDPEVYKYVDGIAWHGYVGTPDAMTRVHDLFPSKHAYWTEGGPDISDPAYATDWSKWSATFTGVLRNWARCICSWNLVLDEHGKPNIGPFSCGGVVTLDSKTHAVTHSGQYRAFAHYSRVLDRDAQVFASTSDLPGISHIAAENPNGSRVLILTNQAGEQQIQIALADQTLPVTLPPDSITTLVW